MAGEEPGHRAGGGRADLAARTGLAPGTVSAQLTALRAAGLTAAHRAVLYARTAVADALLRSAAGMG